jgi:hypothetical protein
MSRGIYELTPSGWGLALILNGGAIRYLGSEREAARGLGAAQRCQRRCHARSLTIFQGFHRIRPGAPCEGSH